MAMLNKNSMPLYKVTVLPKAHSLGHTAMIPEKDVLSHTKKQMIASIEVALGGKVAEEVFLGANRVTTGCSSDLQNATKVAYHYVRDMGMSENVSVLSGQKKSFSDDLNYKVDNEANKLLNDSYQRVKSVMLNNQEAIHRIVNELIKKETLSAAEFKALLEGLNLPVKSPPMSVGDKQPM